MRLDTVLIEKLSIYLLGGAVMAINDLKPEEILSQSKTLIMRNEAAHTGEYSHQ